MFCKRREQGLVVNTDTERRRVSPFPSPDIQALANLQPGLYKENRGRLCFSSPINFVGALLVEKYRDAYQTPYLRAGKNPPPVTILPIELVADVPLFAYLNEGYQDCHQMAKRVLIKHGSGSTAGLVIEGNLTGLILEPRIHPDTPGELAFEEGMAVNRVWNDRKATGDFRPYNPLEDKIILPLGPSSRKIDQIKLATPDTNRQKRAFLTRALKVLGLNLDSSKPPSLTDLYMWEIHRFRVLLKTPWMSELFFKLCGDIQLPVDRDKFHLSRAVK